MGLIIWKFNQILEAVEPYGERSIKKIIGKIILFREKFRDINYSLFFCITFDYGFTNKACSDQTFKIFDSFWVTALFWFFFVKFHKNSYFSENFKYFQKPLIFQAIQWYSRITAKYDLILLMGSWSSSSMTDDIFDQDFAPWKVWLYCEKRCNKFIEMHI